MTADIVVVGAGELERIGRQLKELGDKELRRELFRGFARATKPLKDAAKDNARRDLPKRGGLNEFVASSKLATRTRTSGKSVGVRIVASKGKHDLASLNRGRLRHPLFGNRKHWYNQPVKSFWFDEAMEAGSDVVRRELVIVLDDISEKLTRG